VPLVRLPVTAAPYRCTMNEALIDLLMMAPGAPELPTLADLLRRPDWQQDAACRGVGVRAWFSAAPTNVDRARAVCGGCPVRDENYRALRRRRVA
jgi:hypothetical protein